MVKVLDHWLLWYRKGCDSWGREGTSEGKKECSPLFKRLRVMMKPYYIYIYDIWYRENENWTE